MEETQRLRDALKAVLPYAHTRAEDLGELAEVHGGDEKVAWEAADAAVTNAYKVLGITP